MTDLAPLLSECNKRRDLLERAVADGTPEEVAEHRDKAIALAAYVRQERLGPLAALAVAELGRRADRGLGMVIRREQAAGRLMEKGQNLSRLSVTVPRSTSDFFHRNHGAMTDAYAMVDGVSDDAFEAAIIWAKAEGNLSRVNVLRKLHGPKPTPKRPEHLRGLHHPDSNRIVERTIQASGLDDDLAEQIDYAALDSDRLEVWIGSLPGVIKSLQALRRNLSSVLALRRNTTRELTDG